ncbi:MAG: TIGR03936 family radical SAM-associated protein [Actinomycetota bacterium]
MSVEPTNTHVRIRFSKAGRVRFVSHRDVARLFERALRKLHLPVAYSEGFSPRPKISFGLALTVAHESEAEYLDVELTEPIDLEALPSALTDALPQGMAAEAVIEIERRTPSLQQSIVSCHWSIEVLGATMPEITSRIDATLAAAELPQERERKGKTTVADVRPAILDLEIVGPTSDGVELRAHLGTESVSLRPTELVHVLDPAYREGRVRRTHQWIIVDGARCEPVSPPGSSTRHDLLRAS